MTTTASLQKQGGLWKYTVVMSASTPTLYDDHESPCCKKVRLAFGEKGVAFEKHNVALNKGEEHTEAFRKINPKGLVPVLEHAGRYIPESAVIAEYIEETFEGPPLLPADPYWRARARLWMKRMDEELHIPHNVSVTFNIAFRDMWLEKFPTEEARAAYLPQISNPIMRGVIAQSFEMGLDAPSFRDAIWAFDGLLADMERALGETPWLAGDGLSLADIGVAPWLRRLADVQLSGMWADRPRVTEWFARLIERPTWAVAMADELRQDYLAIMRETGNKAWPRVAAILAESP